MDNQWQHHHHQPIQGNNTCPTCSISHFPFCPPHPSFNSSPRFPSPRQAHPFNAPNFNQYGLHPGLYNPNDLYRDPGSISLHKNPNLDRDSSHVFGYSSNGFGSGDDRNVKRVKVDDRAGLTRVISEEDERRLKLIREHGGSINGPPQIEGNLGIGFREIGNYNDLRGNIVGNSIKSPINVGSSGFRDPGQSFLRPENVPSPHIFREEHSAGYGNQYMQPQISQLGQCLIPDAHNEISSYTPSAQNSEQRSSISMENLAYNGQPVGSHGLQDSNHKEYDFRSPSIMNDTRHPSEVRTPLREGDQFPLNNTNQGRYLPTHMSLENINQMHASRLISAPPPLPQSPPPPPPMDSPTNSSSELNAAYKPHISQPYIQNNSQMPVSTGYLPEEARGIHQTSSQHYLGEGRLFPIVHMSADKRRMVDAFHLFKLPDRVSRPHRIVIILRGLPGSGKSYLAKMVRDLEVENGGDAPRIHSMDDYFMTEVEKDESEMAKSTSSGRGKKPTSKVVMEYCYEPEMEEAYRSSMFKAFKKTIEDGGFTFIIVDDRNLRVADFAQFWAIAKRSGFEVYLLEATYKDPAGCAARNVHGFTQDDIHKMAKQWEEAPSWYLQLDVKSLFHGDDLKDGGIQEVDMDTGERDIDEDISGTQVEKRDEHIEVSATGDHATGASSLKDEKRWDGEGAKGDPPAEQVKELGRSKWSDDFDEDDGAQTKGTNGNLNSLSGLIQSYGKDGRSVHWGDQAAGNTGFSIGSAKKPKEFSLVIGAGSGYNLKSNPLPDVNIPTITNTGDRRNTFQQRLRVERESSKVIFDRRRHKIGLDVDEE